MNDTTQQDPNAAPAGKPDGSPPTTQPPTPPAPPAPETTTTTANTPGGASGAAGEVPTAPETDKTPEQIEAERTEAAVEQLAAEVMNNGVEIIDNAFTQLAAALGRSRLSPHQSHFLASRALDVFEAAVGSCREQKRIWGPYRQLLDDVRTDRAGFKEHLARLKKRDEQQQESEA